MYYTCCMALSIEEIEKLATLARLKLTANEIERLLRECEAILDYVKAIQEVKLGEGELDTSASPRLKNVMRADGAPHERGAFTDESLRQAPNRHGNYIKVKKIL